MTSKCISPPLDEQYFLFLCSKVDHDEERDFYGLLKQLHSIEFSEDTFKIISNDKNRIGDGLAVREEFKKGEIDGPCSFLEFLIGLSYRIEDVIGNDYVYSFWEMIDNLCLLEFDDDHLDLGESYAVDDTVSIFLNRRYARDGAGGLFPLRNPKEDQRKVEIWYQMQAYLIENYL